MRVIDELQLPQQHIQQQETTIWLLASKDALGHCRR